MTKILSSASKIVFIALTVTACAGFFLGRLEAKDFMLLASMAYGYYFAVKPSGDGGTLTGGVK